MPRGTLPARACKRVATEPQGPRHTIAPIGPQSGLPYEGVLVTRRPMPTTTLWRIAILVATLVCVVMLFAPLVREMLSTVADTGATLP